MERALPLYVRRISAPVAEIMSLAEAKLYLRIDGAEEDLFISELIVAVRMFAEDYVNLSLVTQNWQIGYDGAEAEKLFVLPMQPVKQIIAVRDVHDGHSTLISPTHYALTFPNVLSLDAAYEGVLTVDYTAGHDALNQPVALKQSMLAHIALCYERRGEDTLQPLPAHRFYDAYKQVRL
jgi:uncharacterized phiE125 gp8 family phage protein